MLARPVGANQCCSIGRRTPGPFTWGDIGSICRLAGVWGHYGQLHEPIGLMDLIVAVLWFVGLPDTASAYNIHEQRGQKMNDSGNNGKREPIDDRIRKIEQGERA